MYFPNEEAEFFDKIIKNNRYEWQNISNDKVFEKKAGKIILVRDVHKQWYVEGISEEYNSVDKTVQLLKSLTDGYEIVTVGNSAGGYAAVLFGCLLNAEKVFTRSGQFFFTNKEVFETEEGKELMKKWGITDNYVGIGNCILGYADGEIKKAAPRKENWVYFVE